MERYDYVIVGGGSAGSVLANRLSTDPGTSVLVLEAGRSDWAFDPLVHMPAALMFPSGNPLYDWAYESEPEPHMGGRRIAHARGKVLGGSSSINGMIFQRGNAGDYDKWARENEGMEQWDYAHCLPYFKRMETCTEGADAWRGGAGPLWLERGPASTPLFQAFLEATGQAGYPRTDDVNGYRQEGFAPFDRNVKQSRRWSASRAYLKPIRGRKNLHVRTLAMVTGLEMRGNRVVGVNYKQPGRGVRGVEAGEVILCGGAFNSPQLLQLAGIGDPETLRAAGVKPTIELPGVGQNLQDHLEVYLQHEAAQPVSIGPWLNYWLAPVIGADWLFRGKGVGASNHFEAGGFIRTNDEVEYPNLMFHFLPIAVRYDGSGDKIKHGYQVHIGPMNTDVRGDVTIRSNDPFEHPAIRFNYLSTENDRKEWVEVVRAARHILSQPAFAPFDGGELSPGPAVQTDEEILDWVARDAETALHPSCTAAMGTGEMSVVDPSNMRVHGTEGLRVVDASVFPSISNGNIYAPVMMVAEKAADLIAGDTPLAPENPPVYRAKQGMPLYPEGDPRNNAWDATTDIPSANEARA
ncbi:choline dehydrogenase [Propioniferax innocua]|uniref:Choline dehydrogenase n=1 Tax=Propioniferax innocua TaxID=1753 RepID=A0A542ZRS5_9ACTN|nr:choline dehydrogenase [Propioniferax innocua]TQL62949.1 choline dehydrogenase [Propioniferax innocua]